MISQKILVALMIVAGIYPACSKHVSLWDQEVFSNDLSLIETFDNEKLDDSMGNEVSTVDSEEDSAENEVNTKSYEVCETPECKRVAREFLSSMNKSVDPCDDFYEFTCGAWAEKEPIPPHEATWSRFKMFVDAVRHRVKGLLETKPEPSDILPVRQAKKWYRSCMKAENLERRGLTPIESILIQAGGWPIIMDDDEWDGEVYTWPEVERRFARLTGKYTLYTMRVSREEISIKSPELPLINQLPLKYRNYDENDYDVYLRLVEKVAAMFVQHNAANVTKERISKEAKEIVEFEKEIYKIKQGYQFESMTLEEFYDLYNDTTELNADPKEKIVWKSVIEGLFDMVNIKLKPSIKIASLEFHYIREIGKLLRKTPARTIVNYIHWNFVSTMLPYTTERARDEIFELVGKVYGIEKRAPRWVECVKGIYMTQAAAYAFVDKYFTKSTENAAREMMNNIQNAFENEIMKSNWLDEQSKEWAKEKLSYMKMLIGYPEWYRNKTAVINYYKGLTMGSEYFDNTLSFMRYKAMEELKMIYHSPPYRDRWTRVPPIIVNAFYDHYSNSLQVPAADFQAPLFTPQFPDNVNYGTIGVIAAHEMSHGYGDRGILFGKSLNSMKLPKDVLKNYYQVAECFTGQFDRYFKGYFDEATINAPNCDKWEGFRTKLSMGLKTRSENIADSTGLQASFEAYKKMKIMSSRAETKLPGLEEYTDDQLFFISFGATWCKVERPEYEMKKKEVCDTHSPPKFRVIGAVSNTKNFAKAFNCPIGSPMNPSKKCSIWEKPGANMKMNNGFLSEIIN